jgi:hypothetical protein
MNRLVFRFICRFLMLSLVVLGSPLQSAQAGMIGTDTVANAAKAKLGRERIGAFLDRADVKAQLSKLGIRGADAKARADSMTDEEVQRVAGKIDQLPSGGSDVVVVLLVVFVILVVTDILGLTKVFPFTKNMH